jgi:ribosomal-protein-alanine N-acetyltransferase
MQDDLLIRPLDGDAEVRQCAELMVSSEPWITLGRTLEQAVKIMSSPTREVFVAVRDAELAGFVVLVMRGPFVGFVQSLAVDASLRGEGIGTALMTHAERHIFEQHPNVFLSVSSFNTRARAFYARLGYEEVGELRDLMIRGENEILMRKTVGPISEFMGRKMDAKRSP